MFLSIFSQLLYLLLIHTVLASAGNRPTEDSVISHPDVKSTLEEFQKKEAEVHSGAGIGKYRELVNDKPFIEADLRFQFQDNRYLIEFTYQQSNPGYVPVTRRVLLGDQSGITTVTYSPSYGNIPCRVEVFKPDEKNLAAQGLAFYVHRLWVHPMNPEKFLQGGSREFADVSADEFVIRGKRGSDVVELLISRSQGFNAKQYASYRGSDVISKYSVKWGDELGWWYPVELVSEQRRGDRMVRCELLIESVALNIELDPATLAMSSLPVCDSVRVVDRRGDEISGNVRELKSPKLSDVNVSIGDVVATMPVVPVIDSSSLDDKRRPKRDINWLFVGNGLVALTAVIYIYIRRRVQVTSHR